jgi:putative ATPase
LTIELCLSAKSNSAYKALDKAIQEVRKGKTLEIPMHLRDAHYEGAVKLGHGIEYKYPHDHPNSWVDQEYLPKELNNTKFYEPKEAGQEKRLTQIHRKLESLRNKYK